MKKLLLLVAFAIFGFGLTTTTNAQKQFNIGVGFDDSVIPVYAGLDFFVTPDISLGPEIGWRRWTYDKHYYSGKYYDFHEDLINVMLRGDYHFARILGIPKSCDLYAGLNIGFYHYSNNWDDKWGNHDNDHNSGLGLGGQIGFRYFFNSKIGLGIEFCGGNQVSASKFGLSIRF